MRVSRGGWWQLSAAPLLLKEPPLLPALALAEWGWASQDLLGISDATELVRQGPSLAREWHQFLFLSHSSLATREAAWGFLPGVILSLPDQLSR